MSRRVIAALVLLNAALLANFGNAASAEENPVYYPKKWPQNSNVSYTIDNDVPELFRDAMKNGLAKWSDRAAGRGPNFVYDGISNGDARTDACAGPNALFMREDVAGFFDLEGGTLLGVTRRCAPNQAILRFVIVFERTPTFAGGTGWYAGADQPAEKKWDLRSTATHEAGHATGFEGHFRGPRDPQTICKIPSDDFLPTMCDGRRDTLGTTWLRSLEGRDYDEIQDAYPPP